MNKRGVRHIEIILSFVLFVGAIGFALWFFGPNDGLRRAGSSIEYVFREIEKNASTDLTTYSIMLDQNAMSADGFSGEIIRFYLPGIDNEMKPSARLLNGQLLNTKRNGDYYDVQNYDWANTDFFYLDNSESFVGSLVSTGTFNETYYSVGSEEKIEVLSESDLSGLKSAYFSNYQTLKEDFNVYVDFSFTVLFNDASSLNAEKQIPEGLDVFSESRRVRVLRNETNVVEYADLTVKVW